MIKAVIIDDSSQAREALKADIQHYASDIKIVGEADGVISGGKLIRKLQPALIFLDIEMGDGTGFDLLELLGETPFHVIFTTAHDSFAIKALRFSAIDYLLKPIDPDELISAIDRVKATQKTQPESVKALLSNIQSTQHQRLALHTMEKIHVVNVSDILRCESSTNYTIFYFVEGKQLLVTKTLKEFDNLLSEQGFLRVHQSHLVNTQYIKEFVKIDGGYLVMKDGTEVPVSSRKRSKVMQMLSEL
ncbi:MAG: LytTR family DNA-binding domain-containing protein [Bacteroidota bacterium]